MTATPSSTPSDDGGPIDRETAESADPEPQRPEPQRPEPAHAEPEHAQQTVTEPAFATPGAGEPGVGVAPLPEAPRTPVVDADLGRVELFDTGGLEWQPVSRRLVTARTITLLAWLVPLTAALAVGGALISSWMWVAAGALALVIVWGLWLIRRQVSAMSYIELSEDLVVRKGRLFRQVSSVPFGRLQYVDMQSGPLERKLGMATLQIFTASPSTSATIPGLPIETAERMRERLMVRGEAQRAGL